MHKLNGWQRIGVVSTGCWLVFVAAVLLQSYPYSGETEKSLFYREVKPARMVDITPEVPGHCTQSDLNPPLFTASIFDSIGWDRDSAGVACKDKHFVSAIPAKTRAEPPVYRLNWMPTLLFALSPILVAWALVCFLITCLRWIARGFREH